MDKKWLFLIILLAGLLLSSCSKSEATLPKNLFMPKTDNNPSALCSITLTDVKVSEQNATGSPSLILQGTVGAYCGQVEVKMAPMKTTDEVRVIIVAESPANAPTAAELKTTKPVFINMTLDTLPKGRYKLYVNGTEYPAFSTD